MRLITGIVSLVLAVFLAGFSLGTNASSQHAAPAPVTCTFDGGGTLAAGDTGQTSDKRDWVCTNDGTLHQVIYPANPLRGH